MTTEPFLVYQPTQKALTEWECPDKDEAQRRGLLGATKKGEEDEFGKRRREGRDKTTDIHGRSLAIVNVAAGLDGCDDQLLPASFRALEANLNFHPSALGQITLIQTLCLSLFCPVWGYLSDRHSRKWMLVIGTTTWGVVTILLGLVSKFWQVMLLRGLNGVALGSVGPISQSILADVSKPESRGFAFGLVQFAACIGRLIGGVVTTSVALLDVYTLKGWRVCFICVGGLSVLLGFIILLFLHEIPRHTRRSKVVAESGGTGAAVGDGQEQDWWCFIKELLSTSFGTSSVLLVICEGFIGTIPWSAFSFNTMFFQYCGLSDVQAAFVSGALLLGAGGGGILGGFLGDKMFLLSRGHGRPLIGQISMLIRVPLLLLGYLIIPKSASHVGSFAAVALFVGVFSIAGVAVNRPILADVIRPDHRVWFFLNFVYEFVTMMTQTVALEGTIASLLGAPLVGYLAEALFGYMKTDLLVSQMTETLRLNNANALAYSLTILTVCPWSCSFLIYSFLHLTYAKDQDMVLDIIRQEYRLSDDDGVGEDAEQDESERENGAEGEDTGEWLQRPTTTEEGMPIPRRPTS